MALSIEFQGVQDLGGEGLGVLGVRVQVFFSVVLSMGCYEVFSGFHGVS